MRHAVGSRRHCFRPRHPLASHLRCRAVGRLPAGLESQALQDSTLPELALKPRQVRWLMRAADDVGSLIQGVRVVNHVAGYGGGVRGCHPRRLTAQFSFTHLLNSSGGTPGARSTDLYSIGQRHCSHTRLSLTTPNADTPPSRPQQNDYVLIAPGGSHSVAVSVDRLLLLWAVSSTTASHEPSERRTQAIWRAGISWSS